MHGKLFFVMLVFLHWHETLLKAFCNLVPFPGVVGKPVLLYINIFAKNTDYKPK